ncbi:MAG: NAD/NADP octopine/nopaline dehydrogenase family protein, partial [Desulfarculaceae bacterium]
AARGSGAEVHILLEVKKLWLAAFPAVDTAETLKLCQELYPVVEAGRNILEVGLNNGNPVAHPVPALLNAGRVEFSGGQFYHYKEGITPHVAQVIEDLDRERLALCACMGYPEIPTLERLNLMGYAVSRESLHRAYTTSPVFCGPEPIKGPHNVFDRYYVEDASFGLTTWASLGRAIGIDTPVMDAVIRLISSLHRTDYFAAGARTLVKLGLDGLPVDQINQYLEAGQLN